jgi:purine-binding chemotaxis protein CheW
MGIINLWSKIVTVIDTEKILGLTPIRISDDMRTIIVNTDEGPVGLMVDRIGNVVAVDPGEIDSPTANIGDVPGSCFDAVFKTDDHLVGLLSLQSIC